MLSQRSYERIKRAGDLVVAGAATLVLAPVLLGIAVVIIVADRGPAFFRQRRIGRDGEPFWVWKFRTMRTAGSGSRDAGFDVSSWDDGVPDDFVFKTSQTADSRVTGVGAVLRRTSLDELPQLFNILAGEMSLVGPRPEIPLIADRYNAYQRVRLEATPGLTGWAQVTGRSAQTHGEKIEADHYYVRHASLWLDLRILWRTVDVVLRGRGAV